MPSKRPREKSDHTLLKVAGAGALLWLLLRHKGVSIGKPGGSKPSPPPAPCELVLNAGGLIMGGVQVTPTAAATACVTGASLRVSGDALYGDLEAVQNAFRSAGRPLSISHPGEES